MNVDGKPFLFNPNMKNSQWLCALAFVTETPISVVSISKGINSLQVSLVKRVKWGLHTKYSEWHQMWEDIHFLVVFYFCTQFFRQPVYLQESCFILFLAVRNICSTRPRLVMMLRLYLWWGWTLGEWWKGGGKLVQFFVSW